VLDVLGEDFVRGAEAKGLGQWRIVRRHVMRNAMLPAVTVLGLEFGLLASGVFVVEAVFQWPGIGSYAFQAIQASAKQAGFNVTDGGSPDWSTLLTGGDYDASIFGWINPGAGNAQIPQLFQIGNSGNYNNFNNQEASDLAVQSQSTLDPEKLDKIKLQIDGLAFKDGYGLPLFQLPGVFAASCKLQGVKWFGGQNGITWNVWDWSKK
jgi:ABC-type transport system substrate-binding protein